jgi:cephalosporin hydroxylase
MDPQAEFAKQVEENIRELGADGDVKALSRIWSRETNRHKYTYNFRWLGRPIIQYPQDIVAMQEIIWDLKPDLIVETGIAHGGSLVFYASILELVAACGGPKDSAVAGVDIDIRSHNKAAIDSHPLARRIRMVQGSSIDVAVVREVAEMARGKERVLVVLDSNHTHDHVLAEMEAYGPLVTQGSYMVVFDTLLDLMPADAFPDRPWGPGNSPLSAVHAYLPAHPEFEIDSGIADKLQITVAPDGFLRRRPNAPTDRK